MMPSDQMYQGSPKTPFSRSRQPIGTSLPSVQGPISASGPSRRGYSTTAVKRVSGHGYRPSDSPPTLYTVVGCAGKVPESCFPNAKTAVAQPPPRRMSFAEDANTLCTEDDSSVLSQISPPLTKPVVEVTD